MKPAKLIATLFVVILCAAAIYFAKPFFGPNDILTTHLKSNIEKAKGDTKAALWIVEYIDFQCPSCRYGFRMIHDYMAKYPGQIYLQVHYFPLEGHPHGVESAVWVECAREQGKFWEFSRLIYEKQDDWVLLPDIRDAFKGYAKETGLDQRNLDICMEDNQARARITAEKEEGQKLGVESTPTFFVNGKMMVGPRPLEEYLRGYFSENK